MTWSLPRASYLPAPKRTRHSPDYWWQLVQSSTAKALLPSWVSRPGHDLSDTTGLDDLHAAGLGPLLAFDNVEFNLGPFLNDRAPEIIGMDEDVLARARLARS